jgi:hypothetical protein
VFLMSEVPLYGCPRRKGIVCHLSEKRGTASIVRSSAQPQEGKCLGTHMHTCNARVRSITHDLEGQDDAGLSLDPQPSSLTPEP